MTRDEFIQVLSDLVTYDLVKAYDSKSPIEYSFQIYVSDEKERTQVVHTAFIYDEKTVFSYSKIGKCL